MPEAATLDESAAMHADALLATKVVWDVDLLSDDEFGQAYEQFAADGDDDGDVDQADDSVWSQYVWKHA